MTVSISLPRWVLLGCLLVVMSCSGGTSGTGSPVVSVGTVTGFGSVVVNGVECHTASATIPLRGQRPAGGDLRCGQVVTVRGTLDPGGLLGIAETVVVDNNAIGPIDGIDLATS